MTFTRSRSDFRKQLFLNLKGGTGKTTLSAAYGLQLAKNGYRTLFVDMDPQGHLTRCLGINEWQFESTLFHVLVAGAPVSSVVKTLPGLPVGVIPADISLSALELSMADLPHREWRLSNALATVKDQYDVVVMDSSPSISLVNLNAILAAQDLIIPVLPDSLSLHGLATLLKALSFIEQDFPSKIENIGILLNQFLPGDPHCQEIRGKLLERYGARLLGTAVRQASDLATQAFEGKLDSRLKLEANVLKDIEDLVQEIAPLNTKEQKEKREDERPTVGK